jgi:hypothetical protein
MTPARRFVSKAVSGSGSSPANMAIQVVLVSEVTVKQRDTVGDLHDFAI